MSQQKFIYHDGSTKKPFIVNLHYFAIFIVVHHLRYVQLLRNSFHFPLKESRDKKNPDKCAKNFAR